MPSGLSHTGVEDRGCTTLCAPKIAHHLCHLVIILLDKETRTADTSELIWAKVEGVNLAAYLVSLGHSAGAAPP